MSKNKNSFFGIIAALLWLSLFYGCAPNEIVLSREQIQKLVDKEFPCEKKLLLASIALSSPDVYFSNSNVGIRLRIKGTVLDRATLGTVDVNGKIVYRANKGALYITGINLVALNFDGKNIISEDMLKKAIFEIVDGYMREHPVYKLNQKDFKQNIAKILLKDVTVRGNNLVISLII